MQINVDINSVIKDFGDTSYEKYVFKGKNKDAGIMLWKAGLVQEAKEQFLISGDTKLIEFVEQLQGRANSQLDGEIVKFFVDFFGKNSSKTAKLWMTKGVNLARVRNKSASAVSDTFRNSDNKCVFFF